MFEEVLEGSIVHCTETDCDGWDSVLSILQMPNGVPVATVALNGAKNAGILAAEILSIAYPAIVEKLKAHKQFLNDEVMIKIDKLQESGEL